MFGQMASSKGPITGRWYSTLKEGLFKAIPRAEASNYFIVQSYYRARNGDYKRTFAAFRSSVDFYIYYRTCADKEHHEVILNLQKPRFDIDLESSKLPSGYESLEEYGNIIRNSIIITVSEVLRDLGVPLADFSSFVICSSHGLNKYSTHIILADYMHTNCNEAKEFFRLIVEKSKTISGVIDLEEPLKNGILDGNIYKSIQSFRLIGSGKRDEFGVIVRHKSYVRSISIYNTILEFEKIENAKDELRLFRRAAITDVVNCKHIPIVLPIKEEFQSNILLPDGIEVNIMSFVDLLDPDTFEVGEVKGSLITLIRKKRSYCTICNREHDRANPYVIVVTNGDIRFYCRQKHDKDNWRQIGNIKPQITIRENPVPEPVKQEEIPEIKTPNPKSRERQFSTLHNTNSLASEYTKQYPKKEGSKRTKKAPHDPWKLFMIGGH